MTKEYTHPKGEVQTIDNKETNNTIERQIDQLMVDTFGGKIHVEWQPDAAMTTLGQLPFFIEFLKTAGLYEPWVNDCPYTTTSPNASSKEDILGTIFLSILSGHKRYAHITSLRNDNVTPLVLGMKKIVSEDTARRGLSRIDEEEGTEWLQRHLYHSYSLLLQESWILDVDTTIKTLYGKQEGATVGYNPHKHGRPSHTYHSYMIANLRLLLDVDVHAGNESSSKHTSTGLWRLIDKLPLAHRPYLLRGDNGFGTDAIMREAESRSLPYLFKLKCTTNVKRLIERVMKKSDWCSAGQGWQGAESKLQLMGWEHARRVVILRRPIKKDIAVVDKKNERQLRLPGLDITDDIVVYEYAVLVTSLLNEIMTIAQLYRDRADSENVFDELKNQWGWGGFTTQDLKRCRLFAKIVALIYNWWSIFIRLAEPDAHLEAITSRPLFLHGVGKQVKHARRTVLSISSSHGKSTNIQKILTRISTFFKTVKKTAEQLGEQGTWSYILSEALVKYLKGRVLKPPSLLPMPT